MIVSDGDLAGGRIVRTFRAGLLSAQLFSLTVIAHTLAGGSLPTIPLLLITAGLCWGSAWLLANRNFTLWRLILGMVGAQLLLHLLFVGLSPANGHSHGTGDASSAVVMVTAHGVATVVLAWLLSITDLALARVCDWLSRHFPGRWQQPGIPQLGRTHHGGTDENFLASRPTWGTCSRRGPPAPFLITL